MKQQDALIAPEHRTLAGPARSLRHRRAAWLFVLAWSAFVLAGLWWLLRDNAAPSVWLVQSGPLHSPPNERVRALVKADISFQRLYPWFLLGPYVVLAVLCFPLERGRLRLNLPLNLAVCIAFVWASTAIEVRTRLAFANVMFVRTVLKSAGQGTDQVELRLSDPGRAGGAGGRLWSNTAWDAAGKNPGDTSAAAFTNLLAQPPGDFVPPPPELPRLILWSALLNLVAYVALAGLAHAVHFYRRFRERERRALTLESSLAHTRLNALRAQLQPHFLFNSLNAVAALLRRDPGLAEGTLMALSDLLRLTLNYSERQEVTLREELNFIRRYLEIQQTRYGDKLRIDEQIEPCALDCQVPTLVLQPVVENAIRHGIEPSEAGGELRLAAQCDKGTLVLTVEDDGVGLNSAELERLGAPVSKGGFAGPPHSPGAARMRSAGPAATPGAGIGLSNLRARLEALYGAAQKLEVSPRPQGGVCVRIEIPGKIEPPAGARPFSGERPSSAAATSDAQPSPNTCRRDPPGLAAPGKGRAPSKGRGLGDPRASERR
jgi:signal transduction histidine kinase